jgi:hypothetical protein
MLGGGPDENFRARFDALATRAALEIGPPQSIEALDFWLHCLFLDLRENNSRKLFAASDDGGIILHVCDASATFCSRLEKKALDTLASAPVRGTRRQTLRPSRAGVGDDPDVAKRRALAKTNTGLTTQEVCELYDNKHVLLPIRWQDAGLKSWKNAYNNPNYRKRIYVLISKDKRHI